mgnify:FL=1
MEQKIVCTEAIVEYNDILCGIKKRFSKEKS